MPPEGVRVPEGLDDPPRFLLWSADTVIIALSITGIGGLLEHTLAGFVMGVLLASVWVKLTTIHGRGFGAALIYWHLGLMNFKRTVVSTKRHFIR